MIGDVLYLVGLLLVVIGVALYVWPRRKREPVFTPDFTVEIPDPVLQSGDVLGRPVWASLHYDSPGAVGHDEIPVRRRRVHWLRLGDWQTGELHCVATEMFTDGPPNVRVTHVGLWTDETAGEFIASWPIAPFPGADPDECAALDSTGAYCTRLTIIGRRIS